MLLLIITCHNTSRNTTMAEGRLRKFGRAIGIVKGPSHQDSSRNHHDHENRLEYLESGVREANRKARQTAILNIKEDLRTISEQHGKASTELEKLQAKFNRVDNEIQGLEGQTKACELQIESIDTGVKYPPLKPRNKILKHDQQRLRGIQSTKIMLRERVKIANEKKEEMDELYNVVFTTANVPTRVTVAVRGKKSNAVFSADLAENELAELIKEEEQITTNIGDDQCREADATIEEDIVNLDTDGEDPIARKKLLKELMMKAQQEITNLKTTKEEISTELAKAKEEESEVCNERKDLEKYMEHLEQMDREQHAQIMIFIQGSLLDEEMASMKSTLVNLGYIYFNVTQKGFEEIWHNLDSRKAISVGNYFCLRKCLYMTSKNKLVSDIEAMEDKLLEKYDNESTSSQTNDEPDAPAKLLQTYSQTVDRKVKKKIYSQPGGPCRYMQDVMMVIKVYLQNLSPKEKTESSEALYAYVDQKLKHQDNIDILDIEDNNTSKMRNSENKISELKQTINQLIGEKQALEQEKFELKNTQDQEKNELKQKLATARSATDMEIERVRGLETEKKAALETNAKTTEEAKIECSKLRAEKENTYQMYKGLLDNIDGTRRAIRGEYNQSEQKKDEYRAEKIEEYRKMLSNMRENHEQELTKQRDNYTEELTEVQELLDGFKSKLEELIGMKAPRKAQDDTCDMLHEKLLNLLRKYTTGLVEWDHERTELKCNLVEANIDKEIAIYKINNLEKKLQYFKKE